MSRTFDNALPPLAAPDDADATSLDVEAVYSAHAPFVWRALRALGVPAVSLDDALQDTFVVVHRKLAEFHGPARIETWLYAIARRIASHYRRAAIRAQRVEPIDEAAPIAGASSTFDEASRNEAAALVVEVLAELDEGKRDLLVLVELEQVPVPEVAAFLQIRLNTAYSRLRLARRAFATALERRRMKGAGR